MLPSKKAFLIIATKNGFQDSLANGAGQCASTSATTPAPPGVLFVDNATVASSIFRFVSTLALHVSLMGCDRDVCTFGVNPTSFWVEVQSRLENAVEVRKTKPVGFITVRYDELTGASFPGGPSTEDYVTVDLNDDDDDDEKKSVNGYDVVTSSELYVPTPLHLDSARSGSSLDNSNNASGGGSGRNGNTSTRTSWIEEEIVEIVEFRLRELDSVTGRAKEVPPETPGTRKKKRISGDLSRDFELRRVVVGSPFRPVKEDSGESDANEADADDDGVSFGGGEMIDDDADDCEETIRFVFRDDEDSLAVS